MSTARLRPDGVYSNQWQVHGGPNAAAVVADDYDFSYLQGQFAGDFTSLAFGSFTVPAGAVIRSITPIVRVGVDDPTSGAYFAYQLTIANNNTVVTSYLSPTATSQLGDTPPHVWWLTGLTGHQSQDTIDNLGFKFDAGIVTGKTHCLITEIYCDVLYVPPPTTVATGPTGTLRINNPTVTWVHQPGADAPGGQEAYRIIIYDTGTGGVAYDTGEVAGGAQSQVVGPLPLEHSYIAYVYTRQSTDGYVQWSNAGAQPTPTTFTLSVTGPTVVVNTPAEGAVVGTTSPTITWTHTPGAGAQSGQTYYRVIGRKSPENMAPDLYDSGVVASSASSRVIGPLDPTIPWIVGVQTAQTTYGALQWSPWGSTTFTIDVVPALVATVTPTAHDPTGTISVAIARDTATPIWQTIDVEASYDAGATWQSVRGATRLTVNGDTAQVTDYEAPNDTPALYRARASRVSAGEHITGPWVISSTSATWHLEGNEVWLKDPAHPELSIKVCISSLPELLYDRVVGVFRPIGAHYPVVVSDVLQAFSASAGVMTSTAADAAAFLELVKVPVVLAQSPALPWGWGSRYVALGAVQQGRIGPTSPKAERLWTIAMTEVDRPADETAT